MKLTNQLRSLLVILLAILTMHIRAEEKAQTGTAPSGTKTKASAKVLVEESLAREALHAIHLGIQYLEKNQQPDGSWSTPAFPAMTALAVSAILRSPEGN